MFAAPHAAKLPIKLLIALTASLAALPAAAAPAGPAAAPWPEALIEAIKAGRPTQQLVHEFETRLGLDWNGGGDPEAALPFVEDGFASALEANLDEDPETELLALIGRNESLTELAAFKRVSGQWQLAGHAPVNTWYYGPELGLLASGGPHRSFYVRQLESRGTGIFKESYQFFKLIDGELKLVLQIPLEARLYGWGQSVNQHLQARFQGLAGPDDRLHVTYNYRFFAGPQDGDMSWDSHPEQILVADEAALDYVWDEARQTYFPDLDISTLTTIQLESIETLEDPALFVRAFEKELRERIKTAPPALKQQIQSLLASIK